MSDRITIRPRGPGDRAWIVQVLTDAWASPVIGTRGRMHDARQLPGLVAEQAGRRVGLLTYRLSGEECEIVSVNSLAERVGVGSALVDAARRAAREAGCRRLCLITSNDNLPALRFYQKRGFRIVAVYPGAVDRTRRLKPEIPAIGLYGIPLRDEIELAMPLAASTKEPRAITG